MGTAYYQYCRLSVVHNYTVKPCTGLKILNLDSWFHHCEAVPTTKGVIMSKKDDAMWEGSTIVCVYALVETFTFRYNNNVCMHS